MAFKGVSIIGGGPVGLSLALCLHSRNIACKVYERHPGSSVLGGSVSLAPNALRILDGLGLHGELKPQGYPLQHIWLKKHNGETAGKFFFGHKEAFGYDAVRIGRKELMQVLNSKVRACGIPIIPKTFTSASVDASGEKVSALFADGTTEESSMLIGADGIHSKVRSLISGNPTSQPSYTGFLALNTVIDMTDVPESYRLPCLQLTEAGGFIVGPHDSSGERLFVATQFPIPERTREGWDAMQHDPSSLRELFRSKAADCPPVIQDMLRKVDDDCKITFWPFYVIPPLANWTTPDGRISIVGDAAHALPPTLGQGISQGLEDIYLLSQTLDRFMSSNTATTSTSSKLPLSAAMQLWQSLRQTRIQNISKLSALMGTRLLPEHVQEQLKRQHGEDEELSRVWETNYPDVEAEADGPRDPSCLAWIYKPNMDEELDKGWKKSLEGQMTISSTL